MDNKTHYVDRYIQRDPEWKIKKSLIEYFPNKRLSISQNQLRNKGQLILKCPLILVSSNLPKNPRNFFQGFCPSL